MTLVPRKTYSRCNNELSGLSDKENENVDPFDELLSSPLKQEVQFQPLSFWGRKVKPLESNGKSRKDCGLFDASDSDEFNSPYQGKRKSKGKHIKSKARTLQPKSRSLKLSGRKKNYSSAYSCTDKTKAPKLVINETKNITLVYADEIRKDKGWHLDSTLYPLEVMDKTLNSSYKDCSTFKFSNIERQLKKSNSATHSDGNFSSILCSFKCKRDKKNISNSYDDTSSVKLDNLSVKICKGSSMSEPKHNGTACEIFNSKEDLVNTTINTSFQSDHDSFKFVSMRRYLNYPERMTIESSSNLNEFEKSHTSPIQLFRKPKKSVIPINFKCEDASELPEFLEVDDTLIYYNDSTILHCNESVDKTLCSEYSAPLLTEHSEESEGDNENTVNGCLDFLCISDTKLEDLELQNANLMDGVTLESNSASDDILSSFSDEDTVINLGQMPEENDSPLTGSDIKKDRTCSSTVSSLTTGISDLSVSNAIGERLSGPDVEKMGNFQHYPCYEDKEESSFSIDVRNVTRKRRGILNNRYEKNASNRESRVGPNDPQKEKKTEDVEFDQSLLAPNRASLDWSKSIGFANPVFESTRLLDITNGKRRTNQFEDNGSVLEETISAFDRTYALKPGKKWLRSRSVLKQIQNGSFAGNGLEVTRIKGRKFERFVRDMLEIYNEKSDSFTSPGEFTVSNKTLMGASLKNTKFSCLSKTALECENLLQQTSEKRNIDDSINIFTKTHSNESLLEKSTLSRTIKVIQTEERPSDFRSALGLDSNHSFSQDSLHEENSVISARDFILIQCGQEDILPFEEYFNERKLQGCRKIGEGVYGEVFLCSDSVIKVIPIEGSDKVNGEPQKTFEEIISEVVIALKLSNLRKGVKHRTDGFSEMKRCWCVKGKYPEHLLHLWNEYDRLGSGSENDSPVMFKDDQLYIILELANGGKDLESFVFTSSAQSLSVFIQVAFSLAVAEKAFEFEHRDLHWGNLLISETKDKFMNVFLDEIEYKIPTKGVKVCIIDFTLSRINHEGCCVFNDLSVDPSLFASEGDYQFEIYRLMLREVKNDWSLFRPKTNLFWLHYTLDKMLKMVRYKNKKAKVHAKHLKDLKTLECVVLQCKSSADFVMGISLNDVVAKL